MKSQDFPVHPAAEIFPMMSDEELHELAADIKEHGLIHPVMLGEWTADGKKIKGIVDGRNRYRACQLAGVDPEFDNLNGHDPKVFIVSANLERRNLTKGQKAMAMAMLYPEDGQGSRGKAKKLGFSAERVRQARTVLREAPDLAPGVLTGTSSLDDAYREAKKRETAALSDNARMVRLRESATDLAELVVEERLTLAGAEAELQEREKVKREAIEAGKRAVRDIGDFAALVVSVRTAVELGETTIISKETLDKLDKAVSLLHATFSEFCND